MRVLLFVKYYIPGYKSGGPVRTISNLVETLGDEIDFMIVTADRDATEDEPYIGIKVNQWQSVGKAQVFYASKEALSFRGIRSICKSVSYDVLYLNSFFALKFSIYPALLAKFGLLKKGPKILAPRGEFSSGALGLKAGKKSFYLLFSKILGLYKGWVWHASSVHEKDDICRTVGSSISKKIHIASNLSKPVKTHQSVIDSDFDRQRNSINMIFLSRVSPMKNLEFIFEVLNDVNCSVNLDIFGVIANKKYWECCTSLIRELPSNISVNYRGAIHPKDVSVTVSRYELFILPTLGENFGHAIAESLSQGTPVLISDRTPWRDLARYNAGFDLSLDDKKGFIEAIEKVANMEILDYLEFRVNTLDYASKKLNDPKLVEDNKNLFQESIGGD